MYLLQMVSKFRLNTNRACSFSTRIVEVTLEVASFNVISEPSLCCKFLLLGILYFYEVLID